MWRFCGRAVFAEFRGTMPKFDFNEVAKEIYWNHTSVRSPETPGKLCLSTKFPHQEIRSNCSILHCVQNLISDSINTFHATGLFYTSLKASDNLCFPDIFRGYRKRPVEWDGLIGVMRKWKPSNHDTTLIIARIISFVLNKNPVLMLMILTLK